MLRSFDDKDTPFCEVNSSKVVFDYGDYLAICFMEWPEEAWKYRYSFVCLVVCNLFIKKVCYESI